MAALKLGLIVSPAIDQLAADELAAEVGAALAERYPEVEWDLEVLTDPLAEPPVHLTELVSAARRLLLDADWDLAVAITELPLRLAHRTLLGHASRTHGVALVSLPALGVLRRRRRLFDVVAGAVGALVGDPEHGRDSRSAGARLGVERRLTELAGDVDDDDDGGAAYVARVISGNLRLLVGMVGANHPWRLVGTLWRAMLAAIAAVAFGLIQFEVWRIATSIGAVRLTIAALALGRRRVGHVDRRPPPLGAGTRPAGARAGDALQPGDHRDGRVRGHRALPLRLRRRPARRPAADRTSASLA